MFVSCVTDPRTPECYTNCLTRSLHYALPILALAQPLVNPAARLAGSGPVVLVVDDGWSAARFWPARQTAADNLLAQAEREDRPVVVLTTAPDRKSVV